MIDAEFVESIRELAIKGMTPSILQVPCEPKNVYFMANPADGSLMKQVAPVSDSHVFTSIESLVRWGITKPNRKALVSLENVTVTTEDEHHSIGVYGIGLSPQMLRLYEIERRVEAFDQKQMVLLFRTTLAGCVPDMLVSLVRSLRWQSAGEQTGVIGNQSANLGKTMQAKVSGASDLPEVIDFVVPIVADPLLPVGTAVVRAAIDIDFDSSKFKLHVLPLQLANAVKDAVERIRVLTESAIDHIESASDDLHEFPVYLGRQG